MSSPQITTIRMAPPSPIQGPVHYRTASGSSLSQNGSLYPEQISEIQEYEDSSSPSQNQYLNHYEPPMIHGSNSRSSSPLNGSGLHPPQRPPSAARRLVRPASSRSSISSGDYHYVGARPASMHELNSHTRRPSSSLSLNDTASQYASASMFDLNQSYLTPHFGGTASSSLMPRIKTIELYRQNAKKSNDPVIQFQFAQYMLQTALLSGTNNNNNNSGMRPYSTISSTSSSSTPSDANISLFGSDQSGMVSQNARLSSKSKKGSKSVFDEEKKIKSDLLKEAISHLRKLADKGFADAQYLLGDAYASGALGKPDYKESFTLFQLAAKHGHAEAAYRAALCLEEGWGTSKDIRRAIQFLRSAAIKNQPGAMFRLGMACFHGRMGFANNTKIKQEGIKWLTRATEVANEIYPRGPYELAKIYEEGYKDIVFKDLQYTVQLYVRSADLHYAPAAAKLGSAYEYGSLGCPQDAPLSIHYYTIAAMAGDANSMLAMCAWYMVGADPVLPRNEEEAYEWALRAAQRGLAKAQYAVGYFLENGIGCERDILESTKWYQQAAAGGDERAVERLSKSRDSSNGRSKGKKSNKDSKDCIIC